MRVVTEVLGMQDLYKKHPYVSAVYAGAVYVFFSGMCVWSICVFVVLICGSMPAPYNTLHSLGYTLVATLWFTAFIRANITSSYAPEAGDYAALDPSPSTVCQKCGRIRRARTHHCGVCGECVALMDHHCPWIVYGCVGHANYKYFVLVCLYGFLGVVYMVSVTYAYGWYDWVSPLRHWTDEEEVVAIGSAAAIPIGAYFLSLLVIHGKHMVVGETHFEALARSFGWSTAVPEATYDNGSAWANIRLRLGPTPWKWCLPLADPHPHQS